MAFEALLSKLINQVQTSLNINCNGIYLGILMLDGLR